VVMTAGIAAAMVAKGAGAPGPEWAYFFGLSFSNAFRLAKGEWVATLPLPVLPAARRFQLPLVLVVVAIETEQFPVAAVGRIIVVVVVAVMHRQLAQVGAGEFARAAAADPGVDLQRLLAVGLLAPLGGAAGFEDELVDAVGGLHGDGDWKVSVWNTAADLLCHAGRLVFPICVGARGIAGL